MDFICGIEGVWIEVHTTITTASHSSPHLHPCPPAPSLFLLRSRFKPLHSAVMRERIDFICGKEGVGLEDGAFELLAEVSDGDLRKAVTTLQSAVRLAGSEVNRYEGGGKRERWGR